ncbi:MAG TPA: WG repeat-containing protein [Pseudobacteroides sp.]|uniref:WG repeat-containing protein n=1 Tax=Pseudobacteroides sp. TaxID=1968840 RepID=UPI002F9473F8
MNNKGKLLLNTIKIMLLFLIIACLGAYLGEKIINNTTKAIEGTFVQNTDIIELPEEPVYNNSNDSNKEEMLLPAFSLFEGKEKWGFIDSKGNFKINPQFDRVGEFNEKGVAVVVDDAEKLPNDDFYRHKCTIRFIDKSGQTISGPFTSDRNVISFSEGIAIVNKFHGGSVVIGEDGKIILESVHELLECSEGLIKFRKEGTSSAGINMLYGFMDKMGKIIVPPEYHEADSFTDGKTVVMSSKGNYRIIDKKGNILDTYNFINDKEKYYHPFHISNDKEGLLTFLDEDIDMLGYVSLEGETAIPAKFSSTGYFHDGLAVVSIHKDGKKKKQYYGVIDKKGDYIIEPEYAYIINMGNGLFKVIKETDNMLYYTDAFDELINMIAPAAIFDTTGRQLTQFDYYNIGKKINEGKYISVCDGEKTFFIDKNGNVAKELPKFIGLGILEINGDLIKAEIDGTLIYLKKDGTKIWQSDNSMKLDSNITVNKNTWRLGFAKFIQYPELMGLSDKKIEEKINNEIKDLFLNERISVKKASGRLMNIIKTSFSVQKNENLLIVSEEGNFPPYEGNYKYIAYHFDLLTGELYDKKDLFKRSSDYEEKINQIIKGRLGGNYFNENIDINFIIKEDSLGFFYDLGPANGVMQIDIPYDKIIDLIDTEGYLWNSFDKTY